MRRGIVALFLAGAVFMPLLAATDAGAGTHRAGVVVNHGDGSVDTDCVRFRADWIRAIDLLTRTDFDLYTTADPSFGRAVCWLDNEGYGPGTSCFNPVGKNWGVWLRRRGQAQPKQVSVGVSQLKVPPGAVLHLVFDEFDPPDFVQSTPASVGVKTICGG
jgi:hypothetical protein